MEAIEAVLIGRETRLWQRGFPRNRSVMVMLVLTSLIAILIFTAGPSCFDGSDSGITRLRAPVPRTPRTTESQRRLVWLRCLIWVLGSGLSEP
jgi:hypothetical protein